ncbi:MULTISPECIES: c-type cytochrome [Microbacterium]|jgi:ubiquinol-cytochrome c reductase cytochrome c subunit|uniref:Cytochrome bc1 complex cytochrome c subunit n=2 Tax=Microbacterium paraoxydans TaxID=199592 RepID=A0ABZ2HPT3_9MICO|nr:MULTISPECIES: cytochrome c [Microbacterium]AMG84851.1 cystathionine beta-lyase [Microbacterium sp. PAMC 28756]AVL97480.1 cystathionine beta-lyase [Microbacterium sp. str. 'China']MCK2032048.1 cytochrome c [Microbacterium sp. KSW4-4]MCT2223912.1 cytochrome c [Microbacterium paraoxydans]MPT14259.1 c-type cytochrome [Microbacterium sp.]
MAREKKRRSSGRRSPLAAAALIGAGLMITGAVYAGATAAFAANDAPTASTQLTVEDGEKLFTANCATCHGLDLEGTPNGPSLYGVGELAVEFQVSTGRMPLQMQGPQAPQKEPQFTEEQILAMAAYVQSEAPGPTYPADEIIDGEGDVAHGAELFRVNCAMCHNVAAAGGALTEGKYAPAITETSALHIYAAMVTGPQNMPVFGDMNLSDEDKRDIISALLFQQQSVQIGGFSLGSLGPVSEGLFVWIFGIGALVAITVWITAKSN